MSHQSPIRCVLFDLDGVLVDACDWHYDSLNQALVDAGVPPISRKDHLHTYNGLPTKVKLQMLGLTGELAALIWELKQKHTNKIIESSAPMMPEKIELHEYLKSQGIKIACVTNSIRQTAEAMLRSTYQYNYIDLLVSNEDVTNNKPHPDCYNYAIKTLGVNCSQCLCVEDSSTGLQAAYSSCSAFVWKVKNTKEVTLENYRKFLNENSRSHGR